MIIIELKAGLSNNRDANVNKLTKYPKSDLEKLVSHIDKSKILFDIKNENRTGLQSPYLGFSPILSNIILKNERIFGVEHG